jgi:uncharacterized protein with ParB-like and HNH nuclease domain
VAKDDVMGISGLDKIEEIYKNRIVRIPDYQRGYAWD